MRAEKSAAKSTSRRSRTSRADRRFAVQRSLRLACSPNAVLASVLPVRPLLLGHAARRLSLGSGAASAERRGNAERRNETG
jgi:hypothetical protein